MGGGLGAGLRVRRGRGRGAVLGRDVRAAARARGGRGRGTFGTRETLGEARTACFGAVGTSSSRNSSTPSRPDPCSAETSGRTSAGAPTSGRSSVPPRGSPQISHSFQAGSLSAPQTGQRTRSRMSFSRRGGASSSSNSAPHRRQRLSRGATKDPQFVQMYRSPSSEPCKTRSRSRFSSCRGWRKPLSKRARAFSRGMPKARERRTTASSITKAPQFPHSVSSGGIGSWQTGQRARGCFPGIIAFGWAARGV